MQSFLTFFAEGGIGFMSVLTVLLVAIFFAAWKAPRWVRPIGSIALGFCALYYIYMFLLALCDIWKAGDISPTVMVGGMKSMNLLVMYGLLIYFVSHVISFIQKPSH